MSAAVDGSSPGRFAGTPLDGVDTTSAAFTAPANSLLVACVEVDSQGGPTLTITVSDSGGLTWTKRVERNADEATTNGYSGIFTAPQVTSASRTVGVKRSGNGGTNQISCKVYVVTGVDLAGTPVDTVGANNEGGSGTDSITTTGITPGANGLLFAADCDWSALGSFDASSDLTQDTTTYPGAISVCDGYHTTTNGVSATANLNANGSGTPTPPQHKWTQITVRESAGAADTLMAQALL